MMNNSIIMKKNKLYLLTKRILDILLSISALIVFSPIFIIIFIIMHFGSNKGPVFFKQTRVGLNGKDFKIYKFRSMVVNADKILENDPQLYLKYKKNNYKLEPDEDPRITKLGRWLRRTSIDELPQFINILKGDMSIIGPRPVLRQELIEYGSDVNKFLSVKPGAMGLWQASGRSNIPYPERCDIELEYVDKASLTFDIKIMFKNIISIFKNEGAY